VHYLPGPRHHVLTHPVIFGASLGGAPHGAHAFCFGPYKSSRDFHGNGYIPEGKARLGKESIVCNIDLLPAQTARLNTIHMMTKMIRKVLGRMAIATLRKFASAL
jgi:hypothetical protein